MDKQILNITNGDCAVDTMRAARLPGVFLPWRDVLHEGPVPAGLTLEALSCVRSQHLAELNWGEYSRLHKDFAERDHCLQLYTDFDRVVLWFEHDLYDQLQLIQILDWFYLNGGDVDKLSLICTENYLGQLNAEQMVSLIRYENKVTPAQLRLANKAWSAFQSDSPTDWCALLGEDTSALPFLRGAILRQLQEYPDIHSGLSRTAFNALNVLRQKQMSAAKLFVACQAKEMRVFMGDSSFWMVLQSMLALLQISDSQALKFPLSEQQTIRLTKDGRAVLAGSISFLDIYSLDRWVGGVHLNEKNIWCWNQDLHTIMRPKMRMQLV